MKLTFGHHLPGPFERSPLVSSSCFDCTPLIERLWGAAFLRALKHCPAGSLGMHSKKQTVLEV
jgi:hypothetical protein